MLVVVVEDDPYGERIPWFQHWFGGDDLRVANSVTEALGLLTRILDEGDAVDVLFLDHDLDGSFDYLPSSSHECGMRVAEYIAENHIQGVLIIHSENPEGAGNINRFLPYAKRIPFPKLKGMMNDGGLGFWHQDTQREIAK